MGVLLADPKQSGDSHAGEDPGGVLPALPAQTGGPSGGSGTWPEGRLSTRPPLLRALLLGTWSECCDTWSPGLAFLRLNVSEFLKRG